MNSFLVNPKLKLFGIKWSKEQVIEGLVIHDVSMVGAIMLTKVFETEKRGNDLFLFLTLTIGMFALAFEIGWPFWCKYTFRKKTNET